MQDTPFKIGKQSFKSRLIVGTGKYKDFNETRLAIEESGAEIVTVAVRRVNITDRKSENLLDFIDPKRWQILPNTAGCYTAEEAIRTCRLAREVGVGEMVKLEIIGDQKTLFPDVPATIEAARILVKEGFTVLPYVTDDPVACKRLEEIGCAAVMPLAAPIGSGLGIRNPFNIKIIIEQSKVPVIVDAGRRHRIRCRGRDGTRMRRGADEHRHRGCEGSDRDGARDEARHRGGPPRIPRGPHRPEALCNRVESDHRTYRIAAR